MRLIWLYLILIIAAPSLVSSAEDKPVVFYVQLIRGTNDEKPPEPHAKQIGPKLSQLLVPVFRWKHYWEISQHEVKVKPPQMTKVPLKVRDLEIQITGDTVELRLFQSGKLVRTLRQKLDGFGMQIMGGTRENENAWFVVVRQDKPQ